MITIEMQLNHSPGIHSTWRTCGCNVCPIIRAALAARDAAEAEIDALKALLVRGVPSLSELLTRPKGEPMKTRAFRLTRIADGPGFTPYLRVQDANGVYVGTLCGEKRLRQFAAAILDQLARGAAKRKRKASR